MEDGTRYGLQVTRTDRDGDCLGRRTYSLDAVTATGGVGISTEMYTLPCVPVHAISSLDERDGHLEWSCSRGLISKPRESSAVDLTSKVMMD
jgi:hypothetical protein